MNAERVVADAAQRSAVPPELAQLEVLYTERFEAMVRLATMLTQSQAVGEEIAQESFVKIHQVWSTVTGDRNAYLRKIVTNACMSHHRRLGVAARHIASLDAADEAIVLPTEFDVTWDAMQFINVRQRTALILRYYEDQSMQAVADAMGCRLGTAKSLVHRGLKALKVVLEND